MPRIEIAPNDLMAKPVDIWANRWFLLVAGDFQSERYNAMTVAWGGLGTMWGRPFAQVVVRPTRYTFEFLEEFATFTLCVLPEDRHDALEYFGSVSGRGRDKFNEAKLTPIASRAVDAPSIEEAELALECRKIYYDDMRPERILDDEIHSLYPDKDYHRIYYGQILAASGEEKYKA